MRTTKREEDDFVSTVLSGDLLERACDYVVSNYGPGDVFSTTQLREWALDNGFTEQD